MGLYDEVIASYVDLYSAVAKFNGQLVSVLIIMINFYLETIDYIYAALTNNLEVLYNEGCQNWIGDDYFFMLSYKNTSS